MCVCIDPFAIALPAFVLASRISIHAVVQTLIERAGCSNLTDLNLGITSQGPELASLESEDIFGSKGLQPVLPQVC